jgi:hypothetical protein
MSGEYVSIGAPVRAMQYEQGREEAVADFVCDGSYSYTTYPDRMVLRRDDEADLVVTRGHWVVKKGDTLAVVPDEEFQLTHVPKPARTTRLVDVVLRCVVDDILEPGQIQNMLLRRLKPTTQSYVRVIDIKVGD